MAKDFHIGDKVRIVAGGDSVFDDSIPVVGKAGVVTWAAPGEYVQVLVEDKDLGLFTPGSLELIVEEDE